MTPDLSIVARSPTVPSRCLRERVPLLISVGLSPWRSSRCFHSCRATLTLLAHPSRIPHKPLHPARFSPCDLAVFWPSYRSLTTAHPSVIPRHIRPSHGASVRVAPFGASLSCSSASVCPSGVYWVQVPSNLLRAASVAGILLLRSVTNPDHELLRHIRPLRRFRPYHGASVRVSCFHRSLFIKLWV
jgi:hypothetical protein